MRLKRWMRTVPTLVIIGSVLFLVLSVGSGLLLWGSGFAHNMVHSQLMTPLRYVLHAMAMPRTSMNTHHMPAMPLRKLTANERSLPSR